MSLIDRLGNWYQFFDKQEFNNTLNVLRKEYKIHSVMPDSHQIFKAFECTPANCSVIFVGQD
jgi:uracil DNA glycosylase